MGMVTVIVWLGISLACIWGSIYLVTGKKSDEWTAMIFIGLAITFLESLRWWAYFFTESKTVLFWWRVAATPISMMILYGFAHLRLGLEKMSQKFWIAVLYPGAKLILYLLIKGYPKHA